MFSEYFLLKVEHISDMFENIPPSTSQLLLVFPILSLTNFAEMNKDDILCIVRTVNKTNCANDPFNIRKMISDFFSDPVTTIFTDIVNSSISTDVFPDSEKYAVVKPSLKAGNDREELSSYRPLFNTPFLSKVLETSCLKQINEHLSKMSALQKPQSPYRRNHSVETTITKVYNDLIINKSRSKDTTLVILDITAVLTRLIKIYFLMT